ncbi:PilW family protein [Cupriavidus sp. H18C2]|uniref:PilW family protein n=1 Tax=Cupriavidus sp. H18C2 TaxID=3241602 RepID=UPI003BF7CE1B
MRRTIPTTRRRSGGYTLVELMVTLVLSLLLLSAGLAFYMMSRNSYATIDDSANLQERGNFAISVVTRMLRQTAFTPPASGGGGLMTVDDPMIDGKDHCAAPQITPDANGLQRVTCGGGVAINNSDAVMIRFFGISNPDGTPDGSVVDCAGMAVGALDEKNKNTAAKQRGLALLYVDTGSNGKPALMCKYPERKNGAVVPDSYVTQELVPGVEAFQVLYGIAVNDDEVPDKFVTADQIGTNEWDMVLTAKVAMVVRTDNLNATGTDAGTFNLFGTLGSSLPDASYVPKVDTKAARKLYTATVQLHNYLTCYKGDVLCF